MRQCLLIYGLVFCLLAFAEEKKDFLVVSYNVENFFDTLHAEGKNDEEFTPSGTRHWTSSRQRNKAHHIAQVLISIGGWQLPDIVGLCEVENRACISLLCRQFPHNPYRILHYESDDERGIDVGILYQPSRFILLDSAALKVDLGADKTRDILYVKGLLPALDTLHLFLCHLPSMTGGYSSSEWKRQRAKDVLRHYTDSLFHTNPSVKIVVMGDLNCPPQDDLPPLTNKMLPLEKKGVGTEKFNGHWSCLDQFYLSFSLDSIAEIRIFDADFLLEPDEKHLGTRPRRTYQGWHYQKDGYSDHLPIVLRVHL